MKLRISLNANRIAGAYGGANQFANNLEQFLVDSGHQVCRELRPSLDAIFIVAAQPNLGITAYDHYAIARYVTVHPNTVVVHRVNTLDEQRGVDQGINRTVLRADAVADQTIFVSDFIREAYIRHGYDPGKPSRVIHTGADRAVFDAAASEEWDGKGKLRLVTHHWSSNYLKGFDIYERIDHMLERKSFRDRYEFTLIGNTPRGLRFRSAKVVPPLSGAELAAALRRHHLYVTAARHEPAGNHYIEAMACGLPVLYLGSGSIPEYCSGRGVEFDLANFAEKLEEARSRYPELRSAVLNGYSYSADEMAAQYESLICQLVQARRRNPRAAPSLQAHLRYHLGGARRLVGRARRQIADSLS